jgi:hypothetical protein
VLCGDPQHLNVVHWGSNVAVLLASDMMSTALVHTSRKPVQGGTTSLVLRHGRISSEGLAHSMQQRTHILQL